MNSKYIAKYKHIISPVLVVQDLLQQLGLQHLLAHFDPLAVVMDFATAYGLFGEAAGFKKARRP